MEFTKLDERLRRPRLIIRVAVAADFGDFISVPMSSLSPSTREHILSSHQVEDPVFEIQTNAHIRPQDPCR